VTPISAFAQRKGLFAITALASAILLIGALLPGYYVWTVTYNINPLTENEVIELPKTTGATIDQVIKIPPLLMGALKKAEGGTELSPEEEAFVVGYKEFIAACESEVGVEEARLSDQLDARQVRRRDEDIHVDRSCRGLPDAHHRKLPHPDLRRGEAVACHAS